MKATTCLELDEPWIAEIGLPSVDAQRWGRQLRFCAPARLIEAFAVEILPKLSPVIVSGSGDFHHLTALFLRRLTSETVVVSFDNHPDWDVRPPRWSCGAWVNRALELPKVKRVAVWGCGNFECWWPRQLFGNRRAEREGKLEVHPWADDRSASERQRRGAILRTNWREHFSRFVDGLTNERVYVTIDLDCLTNDDAVTNWENGRFASDDVEWAVFELRRRAKIVAADICGAYSPPRYARRWQQFVSEFDHPKVMPRDEAAARLTNRQAIARFLPLVC